MVTHRDYTVAISQVLREHGVRQQDSRIVGLLVVEIKALRERDRGLASRVLTPREMNTNEITQCQRFGRGHAVSEGVCDSQCRKSAKNWWGVYFTVLLHPLVTIREVSNIFSRNLISDILTRSNFG